MYASESYMAENRRPYSDPDCFRQNHSLCVSSKASPKISLQGDFKLRGEQLKEQLSQSIATRYSKVHWVFVQGSNFLGRRVEIGKKHQGKKKSDVLCRNPALRVKSKDLPTEICFPVKSRIHFFTTLRFASDLIDGEKGGSPLLTWKECGKTNHDIFWWRKKKSGQKCNWCENQICTWLLKLLSVADTALICGNWVKRIFGDMAKDWLVSYHFVHRSFPETSSTLVAQLMSCQVLKRKQRKISRQSPGFWAV